MSPIFLLFLREMMGRNQHQRNFALSASESPSIVRTRSHTSPPHCSSTRSTRLFAIHTTTSSLGRKRPANAPSRCRHHEHGVVAVRALDKDVLHRAVHDRLGGRI